jgi:hypothetical protein
LECGETLVLKNGQKNVALFALGVKIQGLRRGWARYVVVEIGFGETITDSLQQSSSNLATSSDRAASAVIAEIIDHNCVCLLIILPEAH